MLSIIGQKKSQTQKFLEDGRRIPVTEILVLGGNTVVQLKTKDRDGYSSIQLGLSEKKHANKATLGHVKGAALKAAPRFLREIEISDEVEMPKVGEVIKASDVFKPGDIVDVTGVSKGKGFAGGVKRHHFKGGPRTHGQSDRERAPGSIGQTTTPGRVYRGKRMAGRMGHERVTVSNLQVIEVTDEGVWIKGLVPGGVNNLIMIKKVGDSKKFVPLYKEIIDEPKVEEVIESVQPVEEEISVEAVEETPVISEEVQLASSETSSEESAVEENKAEVEEASNEVVEEKEEVTENAS